ncbi:hypothetical protein [Nocardia puris]|uniref:Helix-turn-helix protein n=1 Tax=Nocardia puris TaxID=208602 RepID=A0A366DC18_9NOCA|nr:hypothetical protein [Nocardia puris]RBO87049.1 hypothetical protein DFR74_112228 [Nocardia puris]
MDIRAQQAREHHQAAGISKQQAAQHVAARNRLIRQLRATDPDRWTYPALARAVGCTPELIAAVVQGRTR